MPRPYVKDHAQALIAMGSTVSATATAITISTALGSTGAFTCYIPATGESWRVTAGWGTTTLTVTRGFDGTTATTIPDGSVVQESLGAADLTELETYVAAHESTHMPGGADAIAWANIHLTGLDASKPTAAATNSGVLYFATDTNKIYLSTGSAWNVLTTASTGSDATTTSEGVLLIDHAPVALAAPSTPVPTTAATGGAIAAGTYGVEVTYVNGAGETLPSANGPVTTTGSTSTITIPSPVFVYGATGWYAYVTQVGGATFTRQQTTATAIGTGLTLTAQPTNTGVAPPASNTTGAHPVALTEASTSLPTTVFGSTANTAIPGNDVSRTNARTPLAHEATHLPGGADALAYTSIFLTGTAAARPTAAAGNSGALYFASDTNVISQSNGTTWTTLSTGYTAAFTTEVSATDFKANGLTGAVAASRYVGATASGAPTTGTFAIGDFAIDQTGKIWICTVAGTPGTWVATGGGGSGTVTSVALTAPAFLTVAGSPITTSGTLALTLATQTANTVFAGPTTGAAVAPTFRATVAADIPAVNPSALTGTGTVPLAGLPAIPLSQLSQSSATAGQVAEWNGTAWAAATVSSGGGTTHSESLTAVGNFIFTTATGDVVTVVGVPN